MLEDSYAFEFYVTDELGEFLVCFNHHDMVIAAGVGIEWLRRVAVSVA